MPIRIVNIATAQFVDINGVGRFLYGCPLSKREELSQALLTLLTSKSEQDILQQSLTILELLNIPTPWVHNASSSLLDQILWGYEKDGQHYRGDIEALEFGYRYTTLEPAQPPLDPPRQTVFFDELWFKDCCGQLCKVKDLDIFKCDRFQDLSQLLINLLGDVSLQEAWDTDDFAREVIAESLDLFGLSPNQLSASMAAKLLISDDWLPGHLHQLLASRPEKDPKRLPQGETALGSTIAGFISEHYPVDAAVSSLKGIGQKQLNSIIKSRNRMIEEMLAKQKGQRVVSKEEQEMHSKNIQGALNFIANGAADQLAKATTNGANSPG